MQTWEVGTTDSHLTYRLFVDWVWFLLETSSFGIKGTSEALDRHEATLQDGQTLVLSFDRAADRINALVSEELRPNITPIVRAALSKAQLGEYGEPSWWQAVFQSEPDLSEVATLHMFRSMGQHRRFEENVRFGGDAVVTFKHDEKGSSLLPLQTVDLRFRSTGPAWGPLAAEKARNWAAIFRASLCFITGAPLKGHLFVRPIKEPAAQAEIKAAIAAARSEFIMWNGIGRQFEAGAYETIVRTFNALLTYEHALTQRSVEASLLFFVASIESLTVPNRPWRHTRVTRRFTEFLLLVCQSKLKETIEHQNFLEAFGQRSRISIRKLAELLYKRRSTSVHAGKMGISIDFLGDTSARMAVVLVAEIAETAISNFIQFPFSSLWGSPMYDSEIRLELANADRIALEQLAAQKGISVEEIVRQALGFAQ